MYRQILVLPEYHRKFQHVLWRASPHEELREYQLNTVACGVNCAPNFAFCVLQVSASTDCNGYDSAHNALEYQTYVDDICDGVDTISEVLKLQSDLVSVLSKSGLELKKWASWPCCKLFRPPTACVPRCRLVITTDTTLKCWDWRGIPNKIIILLRVKSQTDARLHEARYFVICHAHFRSRGISGEIYHAAEVATWCRVGRPAAGRYSRRLSRFCL